MVGALPQPPKTTVCSVYEHKDSGFPQKKFTEKGFEMISNHPQRHENPFEQINCVKLLHARPVRNKKEDFIAKNKMQISENKKKLLIYAI